MSPIEKDWDETSAAVIDACKRLESFANSGTPESRACASAVIALRSLHQVCELFFREFSASVDRNKKLLGCIQLCMDIIESCLVLVPMDEKAILIQRSN